MYIKYYKNVLFKPSTKFFTNIFSIKYSPSINSNTYLHPQILIEQEKNLKIKFFKEFNLLYFYNNCVITLHILFLIEIMYLIL